MLKPPCTKMAPDSRPPAPAVARPVATAAWRTLCGAAISCSVIMAWFTAVGCALMLAPDPTWPPSVGQVAAVLAVQLLYCGLFITGHDACHGTAAPGAPRLNRLIGQTTAFLYAGFGFDRLARSHRLHHRHPGTAQDPDFAGPGRNDAQPWRWAWRFVRHYMSWQQLLGMAVMANILMRLGHLPQPRVLTYWALPACLSAVQLFVFGTYLPHRPRANATFDDRHRARNLHWPSWLSFLTCYHFGYHHVHHAKPHLPWYALPAAMRAAHAASCEAKKTIVPTDDGHGQARQQQA